jgi:hypothetical protein
MKIIHKEDIDAPIDFVFAQATDFGGFERQALRRGADVHRLDAQTTVGTGMAWKIRFHYRGKDRDMESRITAFDAPNGFTILSHVGGLDGTMTVDLVALSRARTRVSLTIDLAAQSMTARLLLQSLKLARGTITKRLATRMSAMAAEMSQQHASKGS